MHWKLFVGGKEERPERRACVSFGTGPWVALFWWIRVYPRESDEVSKGSLRAELKELGECENSSGPVSPLFCLRDPTSSPRTSPPDERWADPLPYADFRTSNTRYTLQAYLESADTHRCMCGGNVRMLRELIANSNLETAEAVARIGHSNLSGPYLLSGP